MADPMDEPALKMPTPSARCLAENHSDTAFAAAGQLPGSPSPSRKRQTPKETVFHAKACSMAAIDQNPIKKAKPRLVPRRSTM